MSTGNTLTGLITTIYTALDTVSRELVGMIPSVSRDAKFERAAVGQTVTSHVAPAATAGDITPAVTPPDDGEQDIGSITMQITKARRVPIRWQGEESLQMNAPGGPGVNPIMADQFAQAFRTLANEMEQDLGGLYVNASRAIVPASSTLFSAGLDDAASVLKILKDNGAPLGELNCVIDTTTGQRMRSLGQLTNVNESGDKTLLRQGILGDIFGLKMRESAGIQTVSAIGTEASATVDASAYPVGDTALTLAAAGTGTVLAGDIVSIASDGNYYINKNAIAAVSGGALTLNNPGLMQAIAASATPAITLRAASSRSMAFARSAIVLATRAPALPMINGKPTDMAIDRTMVTDPRSGLSFEIATYLQYRQIQYEVSIAWGVKAAKEEHIVVLAGA